MLTLGVGYASFFFGVARLRERARVRLCVFRACVFFPRARALFSCARGVASGVEPREPFARRPASLRFGTPQHARRVVVVVHGLF